MQNQVGMQHATLVGFPWTPQLKLHSIGGICRHSINDSSIYSVRSLLAIAGIQNRNFFCL